MAYTRFDLSSKSGSHSPTAVSEEDSKAPTPTTPAHGSSHAQAETGSGSARANDAEGIAIMAALVIPGVIAYSLSYGFLKLVNYSFAFWLPYYLHNSLGFDGENC